MKNDESAEDVIEKLQDVLGYYFKDKNLLSQSLIHTTFAYESGSTELSDNQRLEFFGDSILGMVVAEYLYHTFPHLSEGKMTQKRALLVNKSVLAHRARQLSIPTYLLLGKGEEKMGGRKNDRNLACALEAIIGAIYLDGGLDVVRKFILEKIVT